MIIIGVPSTECFEQPPERRSSLDVQLMKLVVEALLFVNVTLQLIHPD